MTERHPPLRHTPSDLIAGEFRPLVSSGEGVLRSADPAEPARELWAGAPVLSHVDDAVASARKALAAWSRTPFESRAAVLRRFAEICRDRQTEIGTLISEETGKALWDAKTEAGALAAKVDITLDDSGNSGMSRVRGYEFEAGTTKTGRCVFRPHGVMAVVGPFNFPAHLPNGHIVPALAMGNTIVFKPSDKTPAVGQLLAELLHEALSDSGAPAGVVNLVQGGGEIASRLVGHEGVDGVLFTGSWPVGRKILERNLDTPGRIVALELGGNNAAVVMPDADLRQAAIECVRCAFITTGQRCTCTRRLIVHRDVADRLIPAICQGASALVLGHPRGDEPAFMGPIITEDARRAVLDAQARFAKAGGEVLVEAKSIDGPGGGWYISPGVVRVDRFVPREDASEAGTDEEVFGPLLRICVVDSLDQAIQQANATRYGLAASIFTQDNHAIERFVHEARAGCVNVNAGTAGASSKLPFGGLGLSGNHRPAGAFSLDYCAYPVAALIESGSDATVAPGMMIDDDWLS